MVAGVIVPVAAASADAPANDAFAAAIELTAENSPLTGTTVGSTAEPDEPWHVSAPAQHSVWFTYANPDDEAREVVIDTCGSNFDTLLAVYEGATLSTLHRLASNDDSCAGNGSRVTFDAEPGETYRVALDGYGGRTGTYALRLDAPLANDARDDAAEIWQEQPARGSTVGATAEQGEADHAGAPAQHSVWFSTWANPGQPVVIETCGSSFATRLAVYADGDEDALVAQSAEQSCGGGRSGTVLRFTPGADQYTLRVALDGVDGAAGAYRIGIWTGDDRARPYGLYDGLRTTYSNIGATREAGEPQHAGDPGGASVWFEFSGRDGRRIVVDTCGTRLGGLDTVLAAYTEGEEGLLVPVASSDDELGCGPGGTGSRLSFIAPAGRLLLAVDGKAGATGEFVLAAGVSPANDDVANAQGLPQRVEDWWASNALASAEDGEPGHGGAPAAHSVWFRWTPNTAGSAAVEVCGDGFKAVGAVYTRGAEGLTAVASEAEDSRCPVRGTGTSFQAEAGTEYLFAVDGADAGSGNFALSITRPAGNDAVADATELGDYLEGATFGATAEQDEPAHAGAPAQRSVWYRFEAGSQTRAFSVRLCTYTATARVAVYRGSGVADLTPVASAGPSSTCTRVRVPLASGAGRSFLIAVDSDLPTGFYLYPEEELPPPNDDRAGAQQITEGYRYYGTNDVATREPGEPDHAGAGGTTSRWYRWTAWQDGHAQIDTCDPNGQLGADAVLAVYTLSGETLAPVGTRGDAPGCAAGKATRIDLETTDGTTYWIAVDTKPGGDAQYVLRAAWTPYNDDRADARSINESWVEDDIDLATREAGEPDHAGVAGARSVWYRWTPRTNRPVTIDTCTTTGRADPILAVYRDGGGNLAPVAAGDDAEGCGVEGRGARVTFQPAPGTEYLIAVAAHPGRAGRVRLDLPPSNDDFTAALATNNDFVTYDTLDRATAEPGEPAHDGQPAQRSRWYAWTPPRSALGFVETCGSTMRPGLYTGAAVDALTDVGTAADCGPGQSGRRIRFDAQAGTTYRVAVDGTSYNTVLHARLAQPSDLLATARNLGTTSQAWFDFDTTYAGREAGEPDHAGAGGGHSHWAAFTASYTGNAQIRFCSESAVKSAAAVYRQTGTGMAGLEAVATTSDGGEGCSTGYNSSRLRLRVTQGVRYLIAVDGRDGETGWVSSYLALAPLNDSFASATSIGTSTYDGTLDDADREAGEPDHGRPEATSTVWYRWSPPHAAMAHVDVCRRTGSSDTLGVAVYRLDGSAFGDLVRVGETRDAPCGTGHRVRWRAEQGAQYRIVVSGARDEDFRVSIVHGPANDDLAKALTVNQGSTRGSTLEATKEAGEPDHGGAGGASAWFRYTATRTGPTVLSTCGSGFDTLLAVYESGTAIDALTPVASGDDGESCATAGTTRVTADLVSGRSYLIALDGKAGAAGAYALSVDPPANDRLSDAGELTGRPAYATGTLVGARREADEPQDYGDVSVWWRWTAPESRTVEVSTCGSDAYAYIDVYTGAAMASLTPVGQYSGSCTNGEKHSFAAVAGTTYRFQVHGNEAPVQIHLDGPANDEQGAATVLTLSPDETVEREGTLAGAGKEPGEGLHGGVAPVRSVWYAWTAPVAATVEVSTCGSSVPTALEPWTYAPSWLWFWDWQLQGATANACENGQRRTFMPIAGRQYRFAIAAAGPDAGPVSFKISQAQDVTAPRTRITAGPGHTSAQKVSVSFDADEPATFECSLDGAAPSACTSPLEIQDPDEGAHQVTVRATDTAGNRDPNVASHAFTIDRTPPNTTLTGKANGAAVHGLPPWQLTADEPVSRFECSIENTPVNCGNIRIGDLALGDHTLRAWAVDRAGNVDATPETDTWKLANQAPLAEATLDEPAGPASHEVNLGIAASDPDGDVLDYSVDWGDGKDAVSLRRYPPQAPLNHIYTQAGLYTITVTVKDAWQTTTATRTVEVVKGEDLDARAGDDIVAAQDEPVLFDGSDSRPTKGIERYEWTFGDGSPAKRGARVTHAYTAGTYKATLEVLLDGRTRTDEVTVVVKPPAPGGLVLHTTNTGSPLAGVDLQLVDGDGRRHSTVSDSRGDARLRNLPDGEYTIFADREGHRPVVKQVSVSGGDGEATVALTPGEVAVAELTSRPLTLDEAVARGVDPDAASSYASYEFTASIVLVGDPVPIRGIINNGNFYGASIGGGSCGLGGCSNGNVITSGAVVDGRPIITTMVVPLGGASFMKEFFDVSMTVSNLAPAGFTLKGGRTALELPTGLSLASTTNPQAASVAVPDIPGGGSKTTSWTVQGDGAGSYDLAASYTATLDPSGRSVSIRAATKTPLKVWGATAVEPVVEVDPSAAMDHPFGMRVGVKNVASVPIYNATIELKDRRRRALPRAARAEAQLQLRLRAARPDGVVGADLHRARRDRRRRRQQVGRAQGRRRRLDDLDRDHAPAARADRGGPGARRDVEGQRGRARLGPGAGRARLQALPHHDRPQAAVGQGDRGLAVDQGDDQRARERTVLAVRRQRDHQRQAGAAASDRRGRVGHRGPRRRRRHGGPQRQARGHLRDRRHPQDGARGRRRDDHDRLLDRGRARGLGERGRGVRPCPGGRRRRHADGRGRGPAGHEQPQAQRRRRQGPGRRLDPLRGRDLLDPGGRDQARHAPRRQLPGTADQGQPRRRPQGADRRADGRREPARQLRRGHRHPAPEGDHGRGPDPRRDRHRRVRGADRQARPQGPVARLFQDRRHAPLGRRRDDHAPGQGLRRGDRRQDGVPRRLLRVRLGRGQRPRQAARHQRRLPPADPRGDRDPARARARRRHRRQRRAARARPRGRQPRRRRAGLVRRPDHVLDGRHGEGRRHPDGRRLREVRDAERGRRGRQGGL